MVAPNWAGIVVQANHSAHSLFVEALPAALSKIGRRYNHFEIITCYFVIPSFYPLQITFIIGREIHHPQREVSNPQREVYYPQREVHYP